MLKDETRMSASKVSTEISSRLFSVIEDAIDSMQQCGFPKREVYAICMTAVSLLSGGILVALNSEDSVDEAYQMLCKQVRNIIDSRVGREENRPQTH